MKVSDVILLTEAAKKPKARKPPKPPKPRPRKTLWFQHSGLWKSDLDRHCMGHELHQEEEEETVYSVDKDRKHAYGAWYPKKKRGVTFAAPRPYHSLVHPRFKLKKFGE
jgi:hypothetical protein